MSRIFVFLAILLLAGCAVQPPAPTLAPCPVCPAPGRPAPPAAPLVSATWEDLPGWGEDDLAPAFAAFLHSCDALEKREIWAQTCASARALENPAGSALSAWFEAQFQPWQLVNPDGNREGLVTGYYEPILRGSRTRKPPYLYPVQGVPADLIDVELGDLYPQLKHMRLRGRIEGRRLVPYFSREEWDQAQRTDSVLLWVDDAIDLFFMQIQGSGQVLLDDGSRVRVSYADQNGHPYRSIGRWLIDQGQLKPGQASMQGIKAWAEAHPRRQQQLLDANPSMVFFRELPFTGEGPPGALGVSLTPERSIAVDPRFTPLGAPVWLVTTYPDSERPLSRLMLAQDTGGAIRSPVRADFYWGSGDAAGDQAGKMHQKGLMWVLLPRAYIPK
ncbi:membrane-bound lytic murein transglycosylase A precursor [mine drainage metagenome]|uniref:peptidoglycan lytic exotransglycosylase n=1 Tax=mine drainage metagenome TaxID=410659 RepID=A0A1J5T3V9_9ZZZZ